MLRFSPRRLWLFAIVALIIVSGVSIARAGERPTVTEPTEFGLRAAKIATGEIGFRERPSGTNCGTARYGAGCGVPWGGHFVNWVWRQAKPSKDEVRTGGILGYAPRMPQFTSCRDWYQWGQTRHYPFFLRHKRPLPGDIAVFGGGSHCGIVTAARKIRGRFRLTVVEGNYSDRVVRRFVYPQTDRDYTGFAQTPDRYEPAPH